MKHKQFYRTEIFENNEWVILHPGQCNFDHAKILAEVHFTGHKTPVGIICEMTTRLEQNMLVGTILKNNWRKNMDYHKAQFQE